MNDDYRLYDRETLPEVFKALILEHQDGCYLKPVYESLVQQGGTVAVHPGGKVSGNIDITQFEDASSQADIIIFADSVDISGTYRDLDHPCYPVIINGSLTAKHVMTGGELIVLGDLIVEQALFGFYNDYGCKVKGKVLARYFYPEYHHFFIEGDCDFQHDFESKYRLTPPQAQLASLSKQVLISEHLNWDWLDISEWEECSKEEQEEILECDALEDVIAVDLIDLMNAALAGKEIFRSA